jgi:hypothetical protein
MLTPSQRRCKDAQNPQRIPVEEASQSVVQSHRKLVGPTFPNTETSSCGARDGVDALCSRICGAANVAHAQGTISFSGAQTFMALRIEKAFGVKMDTLMRMQSSYNIAQTCRGEKKIRVQRVPSVQRLAGRTEIVKLA